MGFIQNIRQRIDKKLEQRKQLKQEEAAIQKQISEEVKPEIIKARKAEAIRFERERLKIATDRKLKELRAPRPSFFGFGTPMGVSQQPRVKTRTIVKKGKKGKKGTKTIIRTITPRAPAASTANIFGFGGGGGDFNPVTGGRNRRFDPLGRGSL